MSLWVPPSVQEQAQAAEAQRNEMVVEYAIETMAYWNPILKRIDSYLELVFLSERAEAPGVIPGRWHIRRHNPGTVPSYFAVVGPEQAYREPDSRMLEDLQKSDLWNAEAERQRRKRLAEAEAAKERQRDRDREERMDEFLLRFKARENPGVLFSPDVKWSWRANAKRG